MNRPVLISLIGLAAAVLAIILALTLGREDETKAVVSVPPAASVTETTASPGLGEPSFDVVRIGERGDAVLAGRAMPKAEVVILDGGKEIGRTIADGRGEWVFVPSTPMPPGARTLTLRAHNPDGSVVESGAPVVLVVPEHPNQQILAFKPLPGGGAKLLIGPPLGEGGISVDIVEVDDKGRLFVGGRGPQGGKVHVYLDNSFVGAATVDAEGNWKVTTKMPAAKSLTVRADLVDAKGKVLARVEMPVAAQGSLRADTETAVVVSAGNSLWRIARRIYGSGEAYTVIFQANKDHIRDPDLIYPGQVFQIPKR
ncbi:MAG: LysM peptidoglycan-binding domain-containing protein [Magnetospirillum sp.]|nr:LysM peptidoglycan-binding domain-containing protein [Magnetospirillum sp.]